MLRKLLFVLGMLTLAAQARAEDVVLKVGDRLARADLLEPGTQRYLRYLERDGHRQAIDIWQRTISFEERDGRKLVRVKQLWDRTSEPGFSIVEDSLAEAGTMRPLAHVRTVTRGGKVEIGAYRFEGRRVEGIADHPGNLHADFAIEGEEPTYNFVADIEFFRQLPMEAGRSFTATLFDPPSGKPARYTFKVAGSDAVIGPDGNPIDSWLVTTDYNRPDKPVSRFWFAKKTQFLVRQESTLEDGGRLFKTLLAHESADRTG